MTDVTNFPRGTTFTCPVSIPESVPAGYFADWGIKAELRRKNNPDDIGLISTLAAQWIDPGTNRQLLLSFANTDGWPVCAAELDVLFTNTTTGEKLRTSKLELEITRGVTQ